MLSILAGGSGGMAIGVPALSVCHLVEKVLTNATKFARSWLVRDRHSGMFVVTNPRVTASKRSSSVGSAPVGVERHLNTPSVKSRGFANPRVGSNHIAFSPFPSPLAPWHPTQNRG